MKTIITNNINVTRDELNKENNSFGITISDCKIVRTYEYNDDYNDFPELKKDEVKHLLFCVSIRNSHLIHRLLETDYFEESKEQIVVLVDEKYWFEMTESIQSAFVLNSSNIYKTDSEGRSIVEIKEREEENKEYFHTDERKTLRLLKISMVAAIPLCVLILGDPAPKVEEQPEPKIEQKELMAFKSNEKLVCLKSNIVSKQNGYEYNEDGNYFINDSMVFKLDDCILFENLSSEKPQ